MSIQTDRKAMRFRWYLTPDRGWGTPRVCGMDTTLTPIPHGREDAPAFSVAGWASEASSISSELTDKDVPTKAQAFGAMERLAAQGSGEESVLAGKRFWLVALLLPEGKG